MLDKEGQLEDREKALNMRELDIDENLAKREREIDEKLVKLDNQSVLLTEKEVELERIDKMIESRNEVLININESWSINQTNLINKLQGVVENTKKTRLEVVGSLTNKNLESLNKQKHIWRKTIQVI